MPKITLITTVLAGSLLLAGTTGKITGKITALATGEPLAGCNVIVAGTSLGAATDQDGQYFILNIPPGRYDIRALMIGYASQTVQDIQVSVDVTSRQDFELAVEALGGEEVVVIARKPLVRMDLTSSEARVSAEQLEVLPVREIWDVLSIQSGITKDAGGGIHIRGGRSREVAYWVDGVSVTDAYDGGLAVAVDHNSIQEMTLISGSFNAEYGHSMSGIINMVTKDGGKTYHGSFAGYGASYYSTDKYYKGLNRLDPDNEQNLEISLSGPVPLLADRLTFYTFVRYNRSDGYLNAYKIFDLDGNWVHDGYSGQLWELQTVSADQDPVPVFQLSDSMAAEIFNQDGSWKNIPEIVHLNNRERLNTNTKLTLSLSPQLKLRFNWMRNREEYQDYRHEAQWSPEGELRRFNTSENLKLSLTHSLSPRTFLNLDWSRLSKNYHHQAFESDRDSSYIDPHYKLHSFISFPEDAFEIWGRDHSRFERETRTNIVKLEFTSQVNPLHLVKFGTELRRHDLFLDSYSIRDADETDQEYLYTLENPGDHLFVEDLHSGNWSVLNAVDSSLVETGFATRAEARKFSKFYNKYVNFGREYYQENPVEYAAYLQDKIEFRQVTINIGLRYDWFTSRGVIPTNPAEPYLGRPRNPVIDDSLSFRERENIDWTAYADYYAGLLPDSGASLSGARGWWTNASPKQQLSPRLGIAYPITDRAVIHFSFGHFFQIPSFERLFARPGYKLAQTSGKFGVFGNPDLKPQKTVTYELGLKQEVIPGLSLDLTGYYRDVRDWVSTGIPINLGGGASYFTYVNKDYSNVRGVTLNVDRRLRDHYGFNLYYTYQIVEGSNSNPDEEFGALQNNEEPTRVILPLDWDQRHTLNGTLFFGTRVWNLSFIGQYGSGYPYTPSVTQAKHLGETTTTNLPTNSRRKPATYNLDMNFKYRLPLPLVKAELFLNVFNLLDRRNELTVYGDTGRADSTLDMGSADPNSPNPQSDYFRRQDWFSAPRQIQLGLKLSF